MRRATIAQQVQADFTHARVIGPKGDFARVVLRLEPAGRGEGVSFLSKAPSQSVPDEYLVGVERGVLEAATVALPGCEIVDFHAVLIDGAYHDIDSSPHAFAIAAAGAFRKALETTDAVVLLD